MSLTPLVPSGVTSNLLARLADAAQDNVLDQDQVGTGALDEAVEDLAPAIGWEPTVAPASRSPRRRHDISLGHCPFPSSGDAPPRLSIWSGAARRGQRDRARAIAPSPVIIPWCAFFDFAVAEIKTPL